MRTYFMHPAHRKKGLGRSYLSDVLSKRMALRTRIWLLDVLKIDFGEVDESTFQGFERPYEVIFCILSLEKCDLNEIA
jgi:hypothetical protein